MLRPAEERLRHHSGCLHEVVGALVELLGQILEALVVVQVGLARRTVPGNRGTARDRSAEGVAPTTGPRARRTSQRLRPWRRGWP